MFVPLLVRVLKARYGTLGSAKLTFDAPHATFYDQEARPCAATARLRISTSE